MMALHSALTQLCCSPEGLGEMVRVVVGSQDGVESQQKSDQKNAGVFYLPLNLLTTSSPVFEAMFDKDDYVESRQRSVNLPQFAPEDFKQFIELLFASALDGELRFSGNFSPKRLPQWIAQVMPMVSYFQCGAAREIVEDEIVKMPSLAALAAYEANTGHSELPDWPYTVIETIAKACLNRKTAKVNRPHCSRCIRDYRGVNCSGTETYPMYEINPNVLEPLGKLSSHTLVAIYAESARLMYVEH